MPPRDEPMFYENVSEGMFYSVPVVFAVGAAVLAWVDEEPWWGIVLSPVVGFIVGMFVSLGLVLIGFLLQEHLPFWRRSFWRPGRR